MEASGNKLTDPTVIVVLGASGDLAKKKTFPAIFALFQQGLLPKDVKIVGYARTGEHYWNKANKKWTRRSSTNV